MALEIPNTETAEVAHIALAWNIVLAANYHGRTPQPSPEDLRREMTSAFIETYNTILQNRRDRYNER